MAKDYIPQRDADFSEWLQNFSALITANYLQYGLLITDASALATLTAIYVAALGVATNGATRSPSTIAAKDTARTNAETRARQLTGVIQLNAGVTVEQKEALRITVRKTTRTPIGAPTSSPVLLYVASTDLQQTFQFRDTNTMDFKAMPFGVASLLVSVWVTPIGTAPSGPPTQQFAVTRNPFAATFQSGDVGKMATYIAQWQSAKMEVGPNSVAVQRVIS